MAGPTRRLRTASASRVEERRVVVQRCFDDGQAGRRALLPGVPERRPNKITQRQVDVGRLADDEGVLAARLGEQTQRRLPGEEQSGRVVGAGEHDAVDAGVGDEVAADVVVRAAHELHDIVGYAGIVDVADDLGAARHRLGSGLEQHGVAGRQGGDDAVGRDGGREVPRTGDEDHAERVGVDAVRPPTRRACACTPRPSGRSRSPPRPRCRPRGRSCRSREPSRRSFGRGRRPSPRRPGSAPPDGRRSSSLATAPRRVGLVRPARRCRRSS